MLCVVARSSSRHACWTRRAALQTLYDPPRAFSGRRNISELAIFASVSVVLGAAGWGVKRSLQGLREYDEDVKRKVEYYFDVGRVAFEVSAGYIEAHPAVSQLLGEQPTVHPPSVVKDTICGPLVVGDVSIEEKAEACFHAMRQNAPFGMNVFCPMHGSLQPGEVHLTCTVQGKNIVIESVVIGGVTADQVLPIPAPPLPEGAIAHGELDIPVEYWQPWTPEEPVDLRSYQAPGENAEILQKPLRDPQA